MIKDLAYKIIHYIIGTVEYKQMGDENNNGTTKKDFTK